MEFLHNRRPAATEAVERGLAWCHRNGIEAGVHAGDAPLAAGVDLLVAVGGDGTLLRAAQLLYPREIPVLAVHAGGLGFLSAGDARHIEHALAGVVQGGFRIERRARIAARGVGFNSTALNEVAFVGPAAERFTELDIAVGGERALAVDGDGVVVSTPTGSTAYALAAGGPILAPDVRAMLVVPLAPHHLGLRPIVLPEEATVSVRARGAVQVLADGDAVHTLRAGEVVQVTAAPASTVLVRLADTDSLFARLRDRLGWPA
ncbi:MAG: NAD kinase [Candidatus Bipolaricaulis sibiricus]|uniref:NAD kinase n=1 Tax=Bipolaricaulis sibiricus TaxID=2501609 RepID=A0A410FV32_BIPS1|nr:MAG: NAD kinase [Candidatus Bipolaricaulis sibiricus]